MKSFWIIFAGIALKLEKVSPTFASFNPCPSLPSIGTDDRKLACKQTLFYFSFRSFQKHWGARERRERARSSAEREKEK